MRPISVMCFLEISAQPTVRPKYGVVRCSQSLCTLSALWLLRSMLLIFGWLATVAQGFLLGGFLCIVPCVIYAQASVEANPIDQLKNFLQETRSAQGIFLQQTTDRQGKIKQTSRGTFALLKPNQFRWQYQSPHQQLIVSDGQKIYIYDPDLNQVTIKSVDQAFSGTPAALLTGSQPLDMAFKLSTLPQQQDLIWVAAIPKAEETGIQRILFALQANQLKKLQLTDAFGQLTTIEFAKFIKNPPLGAELFRYTPPLGADILEDSTPVEKTKSRSNGPTR